MTTTRDIIRASLLAPIFVVVPWVALAGVWLALAPAKIRLPWSSFAGIAIYFGIFLHLFLGALSALIAFSLRRFGTLSIRALLVVSGVFSLAVGAWLGSQSYEEFASASEAGLQFFLFALVAQFLFTVLFASWWRLVGSRSASNCAAHLP